MQESFSSGASAHDSTLSKHGGTTERGRSIKASDTEKPIKASDKGTTKRLLVVEDDPAMAAAIVKGLKQAGFEVTLCTRGDHALQTALKAPFDLIVLDLMLPGMSGLELLEAWKDRLAVPILVLSARTELGDRLRSFELGAVDYLPKPFWMEELLARIRARLRVRVEEKPREVSWQNITVDLDGRRVTRTLDLDAEETVNLDKNKTVNLTGFEFNVLAYLVERPGRALSRRQIAISVLSAHDEIDVRTVDSHLARIRKKLGKPAADAIKTVWGIGYRFDPE